MVLKNNYSIKGKIKLKFSKRILNIQPSATIYISAMAKTLSTQGKHVISFSLGEPDFGSTQAANDMAIEAIKRGESHYTLSQGIIELREAVCGYYEKRFGLEYKPEDVIVGTGAKPLLYEALQVLVDNGDEVVLFAPAWVSYVEHVHLAGGVEKVVDTMSTNLLPTREKLLEVIGPKTVGIIINSPSNPTGAIYPEETLNMIAEIAIEKDLWIILDEMYERLEYTPAKYGNSLNVVPDVKERVVLVNGVSKAYAMTGWRIGYALGPKEIISNMNVLQAHLTSNASSIAQWAAYGAITSAEEEVVKMRTEFEKRRRLIVNMINNIPSLKVREPDGAFYVFVDITGSRISDDVEFCKQLLDEKYVAAVPGTAFLAPGYIRLSYACSMQNIKEGMKRIKEFVEGVKNS